MLLRKAFENEVTVLTDISIRAFHSDELIGMEANDGPPDYDSVPWHEEMSRENHLYTYINDKGDIVGGAVLFLSADKLYIGRIFIDPHYFRKGYGMSIMENIEETFSDTNCFYLDTPIDNIRTNSLYQKLGYQEVERDDNFISYVKYREKKSNFI